ncbi:LacI family DNA-binding transcriptional regulator [Ramlibacter sp. AN1133]|uniref:LacI family DNA-binding transcriptional regulator n=1 Tax=Ramlibacter sp. AN1133 TaxID=3133429 RepID=UPI0030C3FB86
MQCNRLQATVQDVAREAQVSVATVSRVFNHPDRVAQDARRRVETAARTLGYFPNASARTLRTQRSRVLGIVLPTLLNPVFAECLQGIARSATAAGYSIVPLTTEYDLAQEERAVNVLMAGSADAMILVVSNPASSVALQRLDAAGTPYVLAYNRHEGHPCVSVDSVAAVTELVGRLARSGHARIAMVSGQLAASDRAQQRHRGYVAGMEAAGLQPQLLEIPFDAPAGHIQAWIARADRPTALICSNDLIALRAIQACSREGLAVPRDISIVGFDGIELGKDLTPVLTTVVQPNEEIGRAAVEIVTAALAAGRKLSHADSRWLAWSFRDGGSCAWAGNPTTGRSAV